MTLKIKKWRQNLTKKELENLDELSVKFMELVDRQQKEVQYHNKLKEANK